MGRLTIDINIHDYGVPGMKKGQHMNPAKVAEHTGEAQRHEERAGVHRAAGRHGVAQQHQTVSQMHNKAAKLYSTGPAKAASAQGKKAYATSHANFLHMSNS
jgi:hypothetical protein